MNNEGFRRLLAEKPKQEDGETSTGRGVKKQSAALGSHKSGLLGMAPRVMRSGKDVNLARRPYGKDGEPAAKKFKSSTPRGTAVAAGYIDRAKARDQAEDDKETADKAERIRGLEEQLKLEQISRKTFERLRDEIAGGSISSTHLIKGLDRKLLERVRRGEDVLGDPVQPATTKPNAAKPTDEDGTTADVDDELDKLGDATVETLQKDKAEKKGVTATGAAPGQKRTRDEIMAELKAKRKQATEAQAAAQPVLDPKRWKRVGDLSTSRIEIDRKGREVLITVDADGVVKKRVRKKPREQPKEQAGAPEECLLQDDPPEEVLELETAIPEAPETDKVEQDDDDDIFEDAGTDYDPLGPDEDSDDGTADVKTQTRDQSQPHRTGDAGQTLAPKRNYFNDEPQEDDQSPIDHMAGIKAVIEKAGRLKSTVEPEPEPENAVKAERRARHAKMLANQDRDLDDMDMGFGASRFEDGEDGGDGEKIRLSEWKGTKHDQDDDPNDKRDPDKKKRKPRKRKGDANSFADIMTVIDRRNDSKK